MDGECRYSLNDPPPVGTKGTLISRDCMVRSACGKSWVNRRCWRFVVGEGGDTTIVEPQDGDAGDGDAGSDDDIARIAGSRTR